MSNLEGIPDTQDVTAGGSGPEVVSVENPADDQAGTLTRKTIRREQRMVLFKSPGFIIGVLIVGFWVLSAIWPSLLTQYGPKDFLTIPARSSPSADAWFGTDQVGRDVFSRVIYGARPILILSLIHI